MKRGTGSVTLQTEDTPPFRMTSLLSYAPVVQCTRDANVVLLLGHFCRNADAHLVKPLIAAAVTLDPIHLQKHTSQSTSQLNNRSTLPKATVYAPQCSSTPPVFSWRAAKQFTSSTKQGATYAINGKNLIKI